MINSYGNIGKKKVKTLINLISTGLVIVFSLATVAGSPRVLAKGKTTRFSGPSGGPVASDLKPHLVSNESYVEKYTFNADLQSVDGTQGRLYFSISINNIGAGDHKLHTKGVLELGEKRIKWSVKRGEGKWQSAKGQLKINAGGIELSGDPKSALRFKVKTSEGEFDLKFKPIAKPWRPKGGGIEFNSKGEGAYFDLFPLAMVNGECSFKSGVSRITVGGKGWGRHTWSHRGPHEWSKWSQLIRIIDRESDRTVFIRRVQVSGDFEDQITSYALVTEGADRVFEGYKTEVTPITTYKDKKHSNRYAFPTEFHLSSASSSGDTHLKLHLTTNRRIYRRNPIAKLSWMKRKVVEMVTKPMEYAYEFDYQLSINGSQSLKMIGNDGRYEVYHLN